MRTVSISRFPFYILLFHPAGLLRIRFGTRFYLHRDVRVDRSMGGKWYIYNLRMGGYFKRRLRYVQE